MRFLKIFLLSSAIVLNTITITHAVSIVDCITITDAKYKKDLFGSSYDVTLRNACGDNFKELLNYTSVSFYADKSVLNPETDTIFYLQSYGQTFTFKLRNLKGGTYTPYIKFWSPKDYSSRSINLPGFIIYDPIDCVSVTSSEFKSDRFDPTLRVTLKSACPALDSDEFRGFQVSLNIPGYNSYIASQSLFSLSDYGTSLDFSLRNIRSGNYYPVIEIRDNNFQSVKFPLTALYIAATPSPSATPSKSSTPWGNTSSKLICSIAREFPEQCSKFPSFSIAFCSSLQNASLQEKVGDRWVFLWKVTGKRDRAVCPNSKYPFHISATGENSTGQRTSLRLVFAKTSKISSYTQYFSLEFR